jgi:hypothetical protein
MSKLLKDCSFVLLVNAHTCKTGFLGWRDLRRAVLDMADDVDEDMWALNAVQPDLDCWMVDVLVVDTQKKFTIELTPYPAGIVQMTIKDDHKSVPAAWNGPVYRLKFPEMFLEDEDEDAFFNKINPSNN